MTGADATVFCVNPPLATWLTTFRPLLECAIAAARQTDSRLVFPANVWIYGPGRAGDLIGESRDRRRRRSAASCAPRWSNGFVRQASATRWFACPSSTARAWCVDGARVPRRARRPARAVAGTERSRDRARLHARRRARPRRSRGRHRLRRRRVPSAGRAHDAAQFVELVYEAAGRKPRLFGCRPGCCRRRPSSTRPYAAWPTSAICGRIRSCSTARATPRASARPPDATRGRDRDDARVASRASGATPASVTANLAGGRLARIGSLREIRVT